MKAPLDSQLFFMSQYQSPEVPSNPQPTATTMKEEVTKEVTIGEQAQARTQGSKPHQQGRWEG